MTDTIFALSSGAPPAAIAVVRVSGPAAPAALEHLAGPLPPVRTMALRTLGNGAGEELDRALIVHFSGDASVTGEPLAELHLHGGRATVDAVLAELSAMPELRQAKAGEFTWRAFENGKIDLLAVESLSDLLRAETENQRRAALVGHSLGAVVERIRTGVLHLSALVEASLDQSDEDDVSPDTGEQSRLADSLRAEIAIHLDRPGAERLFDGVRVVFAGPPNAGKSSLINALAQRDAAIVSTIPGTTRDVIEVPVKLGGIAFVLTDTAGLREETYDAIEAEGISRAQARIDEADLTIWLDETSPPPVDGDRAVPIFPRADAPGRAAARTELLRVSAITSEGLEQLIDLLIARARTILPREGEIALTRRQRDHLDQVHDMLGAFAQQRDDLLAAEHLRRARNILDRLTGRSGTEDMLDALFGTFCIGK